VLALVSIVGILGTYYVVQQKNSAPSYGTPAAEPPGHGVTGSAGLDTDPFDITITYTDDGYVPTEITIKQGQRVRFLNASKNGTWPASSLHPTHTLYPEKESSDCLGSSFDACKELQTGEFFDYTFYYPGEWRFHDHVNPYHTGSITVTTVEN
jgi:plastocyanin